MSAAEDADLRTAIQQAYLDVAAAKLDRAANAANFVTTASGAIGTIYTGLLALAYSVSSTPVRPLPERALAPAIFLAASFLLSVVNVSFVHTTGERFDPIPVGKSPEAQTERLAAYLAWIERGAGHRAWALRSAVVCLGAAVALLPLPFLSLSHSLVVGVIVASAVVVGLYVAAEIVLAELLKMVAKAVSRSH